MVVSPPGMVKLLASGATLDAVLTSFLQFRLFAGCDQNGGQHRMAVWQLGLPQFAKGTPVSVHANHALQASRRCVASRLKPHA